MGKMTHYSGDFFHIFDFPSIQTAVDVAAAYGGGRVLLPPGVFEIDSTLTVPSTVSMVGMGRGVSTIKLAADLPEPFDMIQTENAGSRSFFKHFTLDGNRHNQSWPIINTANYGLAVRSSMVEVYDCEFRGVTGNGAGVPVSASDVTFRGCYSHDNGKKGFHSGEVRRIVFDGNVCFDNEIDSGIGLHQGIYESVVTGNRCYGNGGSGIFLDDSLQLPGSDTRQITIANNICVDNVLNGINVVAPNVSVVGNVVGRNHVGIRVAFTKNFSVLGNQVFDNREQGIWAHEARDGVIVGNVVRGVLEVHPTCVDVMEENNAVSVGV